MLEYSACRFHGHSISERGNTYKTGDEISSVQSGMPSYGPDAAYDVYGSLLV